MINPIAMEAMISISFISEIYQCSLAHSKPDSQTEIAELSWPSPKSPVEVELLWREEVLVDELTVKRKKEV